MSDFMFMGFKIRSTPHVGPIPKIQISHSFPYCTEAFRAEYNAWLLERFGTKEVMYLLSGPLGDFLIGSEASVDHLKKRIVKLENFT